MTDDTRPISADAYFAIIPEWVLHANISANAVRLYGVLRRYADATGTCWPSRKTIATRCNISLKSIDRAVDELEKIGALQVTHRRDEEHGHQSNLYRVISVYPQVGKSDATPMVKSDPTPIVKNDPLTRASNNQSHSSFPEASPTGAEPKQPTAANLVTAAFVDAFAAANGDRPPKQSISRIAQAAKQLLAEGKTLDTVVAAAENAGTAGHANLASAWMYLNARQTPLNGPRIDADAENAWQEVIAAVSRYGRYATVEWSTERITRTVAKIGWHNICNSTDPTRLKRQFAETFGTV